MKRLLIGFFIFSLFPCIGLAQESKIIKQTVETLSRKASIGKMAKVKPAGVRGPRTSTLADVRKASLRKISAKAAKQAAQAEKSALASVSKNLASVQQPETPVFLDGSSAFKTLFPEGKLLLAAPLFSPAQRALVEAAFQEADAFIFTHTKDGALAAKSDEWDYTARFAQELNNLSQAKGVVLSKQQMKVLFNLHSPLNRLFKYLSLEAWLLSHNGQLPRFTFSENGKKLPVSEYSPSQREERSLYGAIDHLIRSGNPDDPLIQRVKELKESGRRISVQKTPAEWLEKLEKWQEKHNGAFPASLFYENGRQLAVSELSAEQREEYTLAAGVKNALKKADKSDPVILRLRELKEHGQRRASPKTPAQRLEELEKWMAEHDGRLPQAVFREQGRVLTAAELSPEQRQERDLSVAFRSLIRRGDPSDPVIGRMVELQNGGRRVAVMKTQQEWLEELETWLAEKNNLWPRLSIFENGQQLRPEALSPEQKREVSLAGGINHSLARGNPSDPVIVRMAELRTKNRRLAVRKTPAQWLAEFEAYLNTFQHYPPTTSALYRGIRGAFHRYPRKADGTYESADLQRMFELDQLARAASRGEVAWKQVISAEETAADPSIVQLRKFWRNASPQEQAALNLSAHKMDMLREDFPDWINRALGQGWIINTPNTVRALESVRRTLETYNMFFSDNSEDILAWIHETPWGKNKEMGLYSRLIYMGENPNNPRLSDFKEVQEFVGLPAGPEAAELSPAERLSVARRRFADGDFSITALVLKEGVTERDIVNELNSLLPSNIPYSIRMGQHEFGISPAGLTHKFYEGKLHLHIETAVENEPVVLSYVLEVDAGRLAKGKTEAELKRLYRRLFKGYLSADAETVLR